MAMVRTAVGAGFPVLVEKPIARTLAEGEKIVRWNSPYAQAELGTGLYTIEFAGQRLTLDFERGIRQVKD